MSGKRGVSKNNQSIGFSDWWHGTTSGIRNTATLVAALLVISAGVGAYNQWIGWVPAGKDYVNHKVEEAVGTIQKSNNEAVSSIQRSQWDLQLDNLNAQYGDTRKDIGAQKTKLLSTKSLDERGKIEAQIEDLDRLRKKQSDKIIDLEKKLGR